MSERTSPSKEGSKLIMTWSNPETSSFLPAGRGVFCTLPSVTVALCYLVKKEVDTVLLHKELHLDMLGFQCQACNGHA